MGKSGLKIIMWFIIILMYLVWKFSIILYIGMYIMFWFFYCRDNLVGLYKIWCLFLIIILINFSV